MQDKTLYATLSLVVMLALLASGIAPYDRATWLLEVAPVFFTQILRASVSLALPVMVAMLAVNLAFGVLGRAAPALLVACRVVQGLALGGEYGGAATSLGVLRELHRWGAHAMVITVWLHMYRVFLTGSYKPPREFNWVIGVILLLLCLGLGNTTAGFLGFLLSFLLLFAATGISDSAMLKGIRYEDTSAITTTAVVSPGSMMAGRRERK